MATGEAGRECVEPRNRYLWVRLMVSLGQQTTAVAAPMASDCGRPGVLGKIELYKTNTREPREIHEMPSKDRAGRPTSLENENVDEVSWKSDAPIVAMKAGNAAGAKGRWFEKTCEGTTVLTLRRYDS